VPFTVRFAAGFVGACRVADPIVSPIPSARYHERPNFSDVFWRALRIFSQFAPRLRRKLFAGNQCGERPVSPSSGALDNRRPACISERTMMSTFSWWLEYWAGVVDTCTAHLFIWRPTSDGNGSGDEVRKLS